MNYTYIDLKKKIYDYSLGILSKNELCLWSKKAYYYFLSNSFLDIEKICTYPFIRSLSTLNTVPNDIADDFPCSNSEFEKIIDVINGDKNYFCSYRLYIPWIHKQMSCYRHKYKEYEIIKNDILTLLNSTNDISLKFGLLLKNSNQLNILTIIDLLEFKITNILRELGDERASGKLIEMFGNNENRYGSNDLVDMLVKYIDCFLGKRGIIVDISYYNGKPYINIYPD